MPEVIPEESMSVAEDEAPAGKLACEHLDLNESFSSIEGTKPQPKDEPAAKATSLKKKKPNAQPKKVTISEAHP